MSPNLVLGIGAFGAIVLFILAGGKILDLIDEARADAEAQKEHDP